MPLSLRNWSVRSGPANSPFPGSFHCRLKRRHRESNSGVLHIFMAAFAAWAGLMLASTPASAALLPTSTTLSSAPNPSGLGQTVTFTATVTGLVLSPSGSVTLMDNGTPIGSGTLSASGLGASQATITASFLTAGPHTITAAYSGDAGYFPSTSPALTQNVNISSTTTTVHADINPLNLGQLVTLSAEVSGCATTPVGTIQFKNGASLLGSGTLDASGHAIFTTNALLPGILPITAVFAGDANCGASVSSALSLSVNLGLASTSIVSSANPSTLGQSVTFTATVTGLVITPTGTVTFKDGAATLGTVMLSGGSAILTTGALTLGNHAITASYNGDLVYGTAVSPALTQTVNQAATTTALTSATNPSIFGQSVTFTATVSSAGGTPTGTVTFRDGPTTLGTGTLDASGRAIFSTATLAGGAHTITAAYGGDMNFLTSASPTLTQNVGTAASTTTLAGTPNPSAIGQTVTYTATVSGTGGIPTGTVTFKDGATTLGSGTLNGAGVATFTISSLAAGNHAITASYGGDGNFAGSSSSPLTQAVNTGASSTAVVSSANPGTLGQTVTFTVTVSGAGPVPTGTVTLKDGAAVLASATLDAAGQAAFAQMLPAGTHTITASYAGNSDYAASASNPLTQTITQGATTTALAATPNPSSFGQSVTFTASVTGNGAIPTGTVTFQDGGSMLGTVALGGSGQAMFSTNALTTGSHSITATYNGDANFTASTSPAILQAVNVSASTTTLVSSANPSAAGQAVTFTATVNGAGGTATGTVTFMDGATTLGTGTLSAGQASLTTTMLAGGAHAIIAIYGGDGNFSGSTSATLAQSVHANASSTALSSSLNPSAFGQAVTYTATVSGAAGTPTGTVTFRDGGSVLGTVPLDGAGKASLTTAAVGGGSHTITATYNGDASYGASTSAPLSQTVNPGGAAATLTSSLNPSSLGQPVTFTATVSGSGATPSGSVTFRDGPASLGTVALNGAGVATLTTGGLATGSHSITAVYGGDANFSAATSAVLTQNVNAFGSTTTLTATPNPSAAGEPVTLAVIVTGSGGMPTGTVTFRDGGTVLGTTTLSGGRAALVHAFAFGTHSITAVYSGDAQFGASTSSPLSLSTGLPLDSIRLRKFQIMATKAIAQGSGDAISGAMASAIAEGFSDNDELFRPSETGLRLNLSAEPRGENHAGAAFDELGLRRGDPLQAQPAAREDVTQAIRRRHPREWLAWAEVRGTGWTGNANPNADLRGTQINALAGLTHRLGPDLLVGFLAGYENFDFTSQSLGGKLTGSGASAGVYAGWQLRPGIRVDGGIARTGLDYSGSAGSAQGTFAAARWLFTGGITGAERWGGGIEFEPSLRVYALHDREEAYVDSLGTGQAARDFTTGRASAGAKFTYPFVWMSRGLRIAPYAGLYGDYYFTSDPAAATASVPATFQGWSARVASGLSVTTAGGASATLGAEYGGAGDGGARMWSVRGRTSIPF